MQLVLDKYNNEILELNKCEKILNKMKCINTYENIHNYKANVTKTLANKKFTKKMYTRKYILDIIFKQIGSKKAMYIINNKMKYINAYGLIHKTGIKELDNIVSMNDFINIKNVIK